MPLAGRFDEGVFDESEFDSEAVAVIISLAAQYIMIVNPYCRATRPYMTRDDIFTEKNPYTPFPKLRCQ
jgi:hypothetical protein